MRFLFGSIFAFALATLIGLGATYFALTRGAAFGALKIGAWSAYPRTGTSDADPYARASIARSGQLPTGLGDGVSFTAQTDDAGHPLDGRCDVVLSGTTPTARFWTVALYDAAGNLVANSVNRFGFTSQEIVRAADGTFAISVSPRADSGNWLPTGGIERYRLMLRLYDTPVGVATRAGKEVPMPAIVTVSCPQRQS
ncbi:MAG TPA: DUF1214 domain-containing protein [Pseudolabrys sp.]|nr:DUF1214 domain-containing protein [Pseudolabrys sp.]